MRSFREKKFTPVVLILESQVEVDAIFSVLDYVPIIKSLRGAMELDETFSYKVLNEFKSEKYTHFMDALAVNLSWRT